MKGKRVMTADGEGIVIEREREKGILKERIKVKLNNLSKIDPYLAELHEINGGLYYMSNEYRNL